MTTQQDFNPGRAYDLRWQGRYRDGEPLPAPYAIARPLELAFSDRPAFGALLDALLEQPPQSPEWWLVRDQVQTELRRWERQWKRGRA